jgi:hypothetical protein
MNLKEDAWQVSFTGDSHRKAKFYYNDLDMSDYNTNKNYSLVFYDNAKYGNVHERN